MLGVGESHRSGIKSSQKVVTFTPMTFVPLYWLVLCVNLTQAGVITEKGTSVEEVPP